MIDATKSPPAWHWFIAGFVILFLALAVLWPINFYDGRSVHQTSLWRYYLLEMQLLFGASGNLGPTSGNLSVAFVTAMTHVTISAIAGVFAMSVGRGAVSRRGT